MQFTIEYLEYILLVFILDCIYDGDGAFFNSGQLSADDKDGT